MRNLTTTAANKTVVKANKSKGMICNHLNYDIVNPLNNFYVWFSTGKPVSDKAEEEGSYSSLSSSPFSPCKKSALALHDSTSEESTSEHEAEERSLMTSIGHR